MILPSKVGPLLGSARLLHGEHVSGRDNALSPARSGLHLQLKQLILARLIVRESGNLIQELIIVRPLDNLITVIRLASQRAQELHPESGFDELPTIGLYHRKHGCLGLLVNIIDGWLGSLLAGKCLTTPIGRFLRCR